MSVRSAFAWSLAGQLAAFLATFGTTVALAHILSPREVGVYAIGIAVLGTLQAISTFGVGNYVVRARELDDQIVATATTINGLINLLLGIIVFACSFSTVVTADETTVGTVLRWLALLPLISVIEFRPATLLQRAMNFRVIAIVTIVRTGVSAIVSVAAALLGASSLSAAYGGLAYNLVGVAGFLIAAPAHAKMEVSLAGWRPMIAFGLKTLSIGGAGTLAMRLSDVVLGRILGLVALGFFSRASALYNVIFQNVYGSLARVLFVQMAEEDRAGRGFSVSYLRGLDIVLAVMWPALAGLATLATPIVALLFGGQWLPASLPLSLLLIGQAIALTFALNHELYILRDQIGIQARLEIIRTSLGFAAFAYGCTWGLAGAAVGRMIDAVIGVIIYMPRLPRLAGVGRMDLLRIYARSTGLTAVATAPSLLLMWWWNWTAAVPLSLLAAMIVLGVTFWAVLLHLIRHPLGLAIKQVMLSVQDNRFSRSSIYPSYSDG